MGCAQSKTQEQEVINLNVAPTEVVEPVPVQATTEEIKTETEVPTTEEVAPVAESEEEPIPVMETPLVEVKTVAQAFQFAPGEVSFNEHGVAFYNFDGYHPADLTHEVHVCKRYSEFKAMHKEISKLMASEKNVKPHHQEKFQTYPALPSMPVADTVTYILGRGNRNVVNEREAQFVKILNAISRHPIAFHSKTFVEFMA